ncbi:CLIP-associating protein 1-like [Aphis craccivora]|uniref:CLIP-associating protein 1-like n=1 Tax=Aphis craccivora TaxID=307492 RepID=A0A6G0ZRF8_APHCR|nr:CLIP-associating protein 1-like [Aphis craccivora]
MKKIFLPPGHKIGKPAPLFKKIDSSVVNHLKSRFAGKQKLLVKILAIASRLDLKQITTIGQMEEAISKQIYKPILMNIKIFYGDTDDTVRQLKQSGAQKSEWEPFVKMLYSKYNLHYDYKLIGDKVRKLKEAKVEKSELQSEIDLILQFKSKLPTSKDIPLENGQKRNKNQLKNKLDYNFHCVEFCSFAMT